MSRPPGRGAYLLRTAREAQAVARRSQNAAAIRRVAQAAERARLAGSLKKLEAPALQTPEASSTATVSETARGRTRKSA